MFPIDENNITLTQKAHASYDPINKLNALAINRKGTLLATHSCTNTIAIFKIALLPQSELFIFKQPHVKALHFLNDEILISGGHNHAIHFWNWQKKERVKNHISPLSHPITYQ